MTKSDNLTKLADLEDVYVDRPVIAELLAISVRRVDDLARNGVLTRTPRGYHLVSSAQAYFNYLRKLAG